MALALKGLPAWSSIAGRRTAGDFVQGSRGIHIQAHPPPSSTTTPVSHLNVSGRVFRTAKSTFSRFITHLTTPGLSHSTAHSTKSLYTSAHIASRSKVNPVQNLPFPTRHALTNGLGKTLYVPRIPTAVSRQSTFQVGLGTARNFSTSRGAFQHFVDNVPIVLRAAYEADVDPKTAAMKKEKRKMMKRKNRQNDKENALFEVLGDSVRSNKKKASSLEKNLDTYFPISDATSDSDVSTYVLIPLAPTPTARLPLSSLSTDISSKHGPRLLPRSILMKVHRDHQLHSAKISSLFMRLDRANVWSKGVHCDVYGDPSGLCTILRLEFAGWTKEMVLGVLGEAGKGWCEVVEVKHNEENAIVSESELESVSSILGDDDTSIFSTEEDEDRVSAPNQAETFDPSASFVMPTLSFSSSVADSIYGDLSRPGWGRELEAPATIPTELHSHHRNTGDFENISDAGSDESWASWNTLDSADSHHDVSVVPPPDSATASWLGVSFSSDFVRRQDSGIDSRAGERFANVFY